MICFLLLICSIGPLSSLEMSESEAIAVAQKIWKNECNQTIEGLLTWNAGEEFLSLGIGHFIWYPTGKKGIFAEMFPELIQFFHKHRVQLPYWLTPKTTCPWHSAEEFNKNKRSPKVHDLYKLLSRTISFQAQFMAERFENVQAELIKNLTTTDQQHLQAQIQRLSQTPNGAYVLLDYLNFKGSGTNPLERYQNKGWGLQQVLLQMPGNTEDPLAEFISSAKKILSDRVELSPPQRNEARWLKGWHNRIDTYSTEH